MRISRAQHGHLVYFDRHYLDQPLNRRGVPFEPRKWRSDEVIALEDVSLSVRAGEFVTLLGPRILFKKAG